MWNIKRNDTKALTCKTERDPQSMVTVGGGVVADLRKVMYALLCLEWITNGNLLDSTSNSAQGYVPAWMGGEFEGERIYRCV